MNSRKHSYFKDDIRKLLIIYAIIPVLFISLSGIAGVHLLWRYSVYTKTRNDNLKITLDLENTLNSYIGVIEQLEMNPDILDGELQVQARVKLFEDIYKIENQLKRKANLYIFNQSLKPVITATEELPEFLDGTYIKNWGIFRIMKKAPTAVGIKLMEEEISGTMQMLVGKAIVRDGEIKGYAVFVFDSKQFLIAAGRLNSRTIIADQYNWVYVSNNYNFLDEMGRVHINIKGNSGKIRNAAGTFYIKENNIFDDRLRVYSISSLEDQITLLRYLLFSILGIFIMLVIAVLLSTKRHAMKKTKDLDTIIAGFENVKKGNLDTHLEITSNDEFETIAESYNMMIESLKEQRQRNLEMGKLVASSQTKQLESQFNPHFLFNTLENIHFMCKLEPNSASKMVLNLSTLLRYSISNKQEEVRVKEDMVYMENYLSILKYRFNQRFHYLVNIPFYVQDYIIPKLILQPMIENAIIYGFEGREHLLVEINGYLEEGNLILQCSDDGCGMTEEVLDEMRRILSHNVNQSSHSGLYNIHRRIQLRYGAEYGIQLESRIGKGTCLRVILPIREGGDEKDVEGYNS